MSRSFLFAAAFASLLAAAPFALAQSERVEVRHADLNLESEAGASALLSRIERAAQRACGISAYGRVDLAMRRAQQTCCDAAIEDAASALNAPRVSARHAERRGVRPVQTAQIGR